MAQINVNKLKGSQLNAISVQICGWSKNTDACQGDSGGPITWKGPDGVTYLLGVVSYGSDVCGNAG